MGILEHLTKTQMLKFEEYFLLFVIKIIPKFDQNLNQQIVLFQEDF